MRPGTSSFKFSAGSEVKDKSINSAKSVKIDDLLRNTNCQHILKIDIDGANFDVLKGAVTSLKSAAIISVSIEFDEKQQKEIEMFVSAFGFKAEDKNNYLNVHPYLQ